MFDWMLLFLQIMLINIVLSGDNAVVIALASKNLPREQRKQAVWWGAFGAVALRLALTLIAVKILQIAFIQAAGSILLLYIAIKLLIEEEGQTRVKEASTLGKAVRTIILADFVMSLDNVLAVAAKADNDFSVLIVGIGLSVPIIIFGSSFVMKLLHRFPVLVYIGAGILGYTAGEMLMKEPRITALLGQDMLHSTVPVVMTGIVIAAGLIHKVLRTLAREA